MIQHHLFTSSLRQNTSNAAVSQNGDWGGTATRFGVFGQNRSSSSINAQQKSVVHDWDNRTRSAYRRARRQIGRSNLRKRDSNSNNVNRNIYALISPPRTAPISRRRTAPITSPILIRPRAKTSHSKRKRPKPPIIEKKLGDPSQIVREAVRFERVAPDSEILPPITNEDHHLFNSPSKENLKFFNSIAPSPVKAQERWEMLRDHVKPLIRSESAPALLKVATDAQRFLTTSHSTLKLREPTQKKEILSPGRKERILRNQKRIQHYVQKQRQAATLRDLKNVESKKALKESYDKNIDRLEEFNSRQEKKKKTMWGLT